MPYSHSFSPEFYADPNAPFDPERPRTVEQAIQAMSDEEWAELAEEVFDVPPDLLTVDDVMQKILKTDTVSNLDSPVEVWIDEEGWFVLDVYDD